jgi:hypothetical protein
MTQLEAYLQTPDLVDEVNSWIGAELQSVETRVLSPDEAALDLCMRSMETSAYTSGPFVGFTPILKKDMNQLRYLDDVGRAEAARIFMQKVKVLDGRTLYFPSIADGTIRRTLVRLVGKNEDGVALTVFGAPAKFAVTNAERKLLSAVNGFDNEKIGSHDYGIKTEPGHVALTSAVVLGAYELDEGVSLHGAVHAFGHKTGSDRNILTAAAKNGQYVGAPLRSKEYTFDTWPPGLELLWHPQNKTVEALDDDTAVQSVQAAGFVALKEAKLIDTAVNALGSMK